MAKGSCRRVTSVARSITRMACFVKDHVALEAGLTDDTMYSESLYATPAVVFTSSTVPCQPKPAAPPCPPASQARLPFRASVRSGIRARM